MTLEYPTEYKDSKGTEHSKFRTDGETLKINLRGIEFEGHFWTLTPIEEQKENAKKLFELNENGELNGIMDYSIGAPPAYSLKVEIPIKIITVDNNEIDAKIDYGAHKMNFIIAGKSFKFEIENFEYGLSPKFTTSLNIKCVKCCLNCQFSEYSPFGNEEYGDMMCFKRCKEEWSKIGYTGLKDSENWEKVKNRITTQEAYWCEEFKLKD